MSAEQEQLKLDLEGDEEGKKPDKVILPEVKVTEDDDIKVEVVDDTPPEDRGRKPLPKEVVEELDKDDLEEYSEKVKKRINQTKKAWHDERRAKEAALREREQAMAFAQRAYEENRALRQRLGTGEKVFISEVTQAASIQIESAKAALKQAFEAGDTDKIAAAQEALTDAKLRLREVQSFRPSLQEEEESVQQPQRYQQAPSVTVDAKAEAWRDKNTWFGSDKGMTAFALGLHEELVENGVDPSSDEYYDQINRAVRKRFPEQFEEEQDNAERTGRTQTRRTTTTVVAPATRAPAPRQVRLTASELALAKKFGLTPEQYAREKIKLEMSNG